MRDNNAKNQYEFWLEILKLQMSKKKSSEALEAAIDRQVKKDSFINGIDEKAFSQAIKVNRKQAAGKKRFKVFLFIILGMVLLVGSAWGIREWVQKTNHYKKEISNSESTNNDTDSSSDVLPTPIINVDSEEIVWEEPAEETTETHASTEESPLLEPEETQKPIEDDPSQVLEEPVDAMTEPQQDDDGITDEEVSIPVTTEIIGDCKWNCEWIVPNLLPDTSYLVFVEEQSQNYLTSTSRVSLKGIHSSEDIENLYPVEDCYRGKCFIGQHKAGKDGELHLTGEQYFNVELILDGEIYSDGRDITKKALRKALPMLTFQFYQLKKPILQTQTILDVMLLNTPSEDIAATTKKSLLISDKIATSLPPISDGNYVLILDGLDLPGGYDYTYTSAHIGVVKPGSGDSSQFYPPMMLEKKGTYNSNSNQTYWVINGAIEKESFFIIVLDDNITKLEGPIMLILGVMK